MENFFHKCKILHSEKYDYSLSVNHLLNYLSCRFTALKQGRKHKVLHGTRAKYNAALSRCRCNTLTPLYHRLKLKSLSKHFKNKGILLKVLHG
jgi:hypothetical protein